VFKWQLKSTNGLLATFVPHKDALQPLGSVAAETRQEPDFQRCIFDLLRSGGACSFVALRPSAVQSNAKVPSGFINGGDFILPREMI
jgi:hypothetical protein